VNLLQSHHQLDLIVTIGKAVITLQ